MRAPQKKKRDAGGCVVVLGALLTLLVAGPFF
jgi:hypothetical protein